MSTYSAIDTLVAIVDGDTIVPGMGVVLPTGVGLTQYYDPETTDVTPNYANTPIMFYPQCYSSASGKFVVPTTGKWYKGNPEASGALILDIANTAVESGYSSVFEKSSYTVNGLVFPALKIKGNLASSTNLNDVPIYFKGEFNGIECMCNGEVKVVSTTGKEFDILINCVNEDGNPDTVIDNDSEKLELTPQLQCNGVTQATSSSNWTWYRGSVAAANKVTHSAGVTELSGEVLTLYDGGVEGTEEYIAVYKDSSREIRKHIQVSDTHDPYYIDIGRSTNSNQVHSTDTVKHTPSVIKRTDGTIVSSAKFTFNVYSEDGTYDVTQANVTSYTVSGADVKNYGGLHVRITCSI